MIPKIQEMKASSARPRRTAATRSFFSRGRARGAGGGPPGSGSAGPRPRGGAPPPRRSPGSAIPPPERFRAAAAGSPYASSPSSCSRAGGSSIGWAVSAVAPGRVGRRGDCVDPQHPSAASRAGLARRAQRVSLALAGGPSRTVSAQMTPPEADAARLSKGAVEALPEGRLAEQLARGPAAARQARDRPDGARHPPRPRRGAREAAPVPGRGPHRGADHRRLHGPRRRPQRAVGRAARCSRRSRSTPTPRPSRSRRSRSSTPGAPRCAATASGSTWAPRSCSGSLRRFTIARLLERDDFTNRMQAGKPISALELLYPVMQGYDSVAVEADVELGGTDQKFNLLFARDVQDALGEPAQSVMTMPILPGTDGVQRMSKSLGNYVGVTDPPEEMFGKLMSVPDDAMGEYWTLLLGRRPTRAHPRRGEARARAPAGRALLGRRRGRGGRAALRPGPRAPRDARGRADGRARPGARRRGPSAGADLAALRGQHERGAPPAQPGRRQARRRAARPEPPRPRPPTSSRGRVLQVGKRRFVRVAE